MRIISVDPEVPGVFAIGQFAYGIIAVGQMATGVIAIGQVARGVVAIGQLAIGFVAIGQLAFGLFAGVAMLGVFGRGFPLGLVPRLGKPRQLPPTTKAGNLRTSYGDGWIEAEIGTDETGLPHLRADGLRAADIRLAASLVRPAMAEMRRYAEPKVIAHVRRIGEDLVCDRLLHVPVPVTDRTGFWPLTGFRMAALVVLAVVVWFVVWPPVQAMAG
jgi:hypothetical protein